MGTARMLTIGWSPDGWWHSYHMALTVGMSKISRKAVFDIFAEIILQKRSAHPRIAARCYAPRHDSMGGAIVRGFNASCLTCQLPTLQQRCVITMFMRYLQHKLDSTLYLKLDTLA